MTKRLLVSLVLTVIFCLLATLTSIVVKKMSFWHKSPRIQFDKTQHAFGTVLPGQHIDQEFAFSNAGTATLMIKNIRTSCGCTVANISSTKVAPGASGVLSVYYEAPKFKGQVKHDITIVTNDPKNTISRLSISANIIPRFSLDPSMFYFGMLDNRQLPMKTAVKLLSRTSVENITTQPVRIKSANKHISLDCSKQEKDNYLISVTLEQGVPIGIIRDNVMLLIDGTEVSIPIVGRIIGKIYPVPSELFWGRVPPNTKTAREIIINTRNGKAKIVETIVEGSIKQILQASVPNSSGMCVITVLETKGISKKGGISGVIRVKVKDENDGLLEVIVPTSVILI